MYKDNGGHCNGEVLTVPRQNDPYRKDKYVWRVCSICGKGRWVELWHDKKGTRMCRVCAGKYVSNLPHYNGAKHPRWKGGRSIKTDGYVFILTPGHKRANNHGYVREHILVWERVNGELPEGYVIHHLNGDKHDNRIENLIALPSCKHHSNLVNQALQKRIRQLEEEINNVLKVNG